MTDQPMKPKIPSTIARRTFLKRASQALAAGALVGAPQIVPSRVLGAAGRPGANDRLIIGHIGVGGMGTGHLQYMLERMRRGDVEVVAVSDCDRNRLAKAVETAGPQATAYSDYRELLERKDIDAVVIATPDHWHAVQTVHAAERGKHVYVEKPASCTIEEGKAMTDAARQNQVVVQVGSQGRSQREAFQAHQYIANGMIGRVNKVTCWHYPSPADNNPVADSEPPAELDWDMWLGPLRWRPYNARYLHGTFRWIMESGGGQIRDRGAHVMSNALHFMNADHTGPVTIEAKGAVPKKGLWDSAMTMEAVYEFKNPDWTLVWAQPGERIPYFDEQKRKMLGIRDGYGAVYHGDKDKLVVWVGDGQVFTETKAIEYRRPPGGVEVHQSPNFDHHQDWMVSIRTGRKPVMNIEAGVATANLTILGNLSLILGRKLQWDPVKQTIIGDDQAQRMMSRPQRFPYVL
jgi:predicted dehydrogenase